MAEDGESLESWLNKATNPSNRHEDWEYIMGFCDQINKELEGPQISVRLLAHKIQSPQEWEAIQALTVLEACMKNCGRRFHNEVGKFRFLNELIKVVSPKYLGDKVSERVKGKVIEMLYSWTVSLPDEAKICEAYQMLKTQGIVSVDPEIPLDATLIPSPSPRPKNPVFDDEAKSRKLAQLLKSKKPEDLQEANRLIKNMVKEDEVRAQKAIQQKSTLEAVNNSVKLLNEMLAYFSPEDSTKGDKDLIQELYGDCDKLRETVFQLATETEDNDSNLGDILQASDDLSQVINSYKKIVEGQTINGETKGAQEMPLPVRQGSNCTMQSENLIDLASLDTQSPSPLEQQPTVCLSIPADLLCGSATTAPQLASPGEPSAALSLLDEELLSLGLNEPTPVVHKSIDKQLLQNTSQDLDLFDTNSPAIPAFSSPSLFQHTHSITGALSNLPNLSQPTPTITFPSPVFPAPPLSTQSVFETSSSSVLTSTAPPVLSQTCSMALSASMATPVEPSQSASLSLTDNLQDLALLDLGSLKNVPSVNFGSSLVKCENQYSPSSLPLNVDATVGTSDHQEDSLVLHSLSPILPVSQPTSDCGEEVTLANIFVPLDAIRPSKMCPVMAYDKSGIRVLLHFATDCPPGRPDVLVMVASMLNTAPLPVRNIVLQAAVPKTMKVRLQPPSGTELAPFNPVLPPAAITQVMLLANPRKESVRMRYKLTFKLGEHPHSEVGEINDFPPTERWGAL